jgi:hypothetical protein
MTWETEDGTHEGWVAPLFADGAISASSGFDTYTVSYDAAGASLFDRDEWRPGAAVVGWVAACTCGWRGQPWLRAAELSDEDLAARRVYGDYRADDGRLLFDPEQATVSAAVRTEWQQHVEPDLLLAEIAELTEQRNDLDRRLAGTVAKARQAGSTWDAIGRAAGITRQSAHERWRDSS